jgi:hypothetical protein
MNFKQKQWRHEMAQKTDDRKLPKSSLIRPTVQFYSVKNRASMFCESQHEKDGFKMLEFSPKVESYVTQPKSFKWTFDGKNLRYTPDVLIKYCADTYEYVEIKPLSKTTTESFNRKFSALQDEFINGQNIRLRLMTCEDIRHGDDHTLRHHLYRFLKNDIGGQRFTDIGMSTIPKLSQISLRELADAYGSEGFKDCDAYTFVARNFSKINFFGRPTLTTNSTINWKF